MTTLRKIANAALDLLFPPKCVACGREGAYLCDTCEPTLTVVNQQHWDKWRPERITVMESQR